MTNHGPLVIELDEDAGHADVAGAPEIDAPEGRAMQAVLAGMARRRGTRELIGQGLAAGLRVLISVPPDTRAAFDAFTEGDATELAADPQRRAAMGAAARRRIETELGWPHLARRYLAHFERMRATREISHG